MFIQDLSWWLVIETVAHVVRIAAGSEEPDCIEATASGGNAVAGKYQAWALQAFNCRHAFVHFCFAFILGYVLLPPFADGKLLATNLSRKNHQ